MFSAIFKKDDNAFIVLDVYFKGMWEFDSEHLKLYLQFLSERIRDAHNVGRGEIARRFVDNAKELGTSTEKAREVADFINDQRMPLLTNYSPSHLCKRLDELQPGILTPPTPIVEVTAACNYHCPWCYLPPAREVVNTFTLEQFENNVVLPLVREFGLLEWCLTGGEPTLAPARTIAMAKIITRCTEEELGRKPLAIYLLTNGSYLLENVAKFVKAGINCYQVALASPCAEKDAKLRIYREDRHWFQNALEGLRLAKSLGAVTEVNMILQPMRDPARSNVNDIREMMTLANALKLNTLRVIPAVPVGHAMQNCITFSRSEYHAIRDAVRDNMSLLEGTILDCPLVQEIEPDRSVYCRAGTLWCYVNFRGEVYPCNNLQDTRLVCSELTTREESLANIWRTSPLLNLMRDYNRRTLDERCMGCEERFACAGECRAMTWARYGQVDLATKPVTCFRDSEGYILSQARM
jgi:radical SAM protein with 4Fe4S-binding SPASM domain